MFEKRRTHPLSIILAPIEYIQSQIIFILLLFFISGSDNKSTFFGIVGVILVLVLINQLIRWITFKYYLTEDELRIEYGVFVKKRTYISKQRIQSIDLTESLWHRLFSLVKVEVQTAGTQGDSKPVINAVSRELGYAFRAELQEYLDNEVEFQDDEIVESQESTRTLRHREDRPKLRISYKRLLISGLTSGGVGVIIAFSIAGVSQFEELVSEDMYEAAYAFFIQSSIFGIASLITGVLLIAWIISVGLTLVRYGNFTIQKNEDELLITYGLIEKKHQTIPLERIQAVGYKQNLVRELFGFGTLYADVAGGSIEDLKGEAGTMLFPILKTKEVAMFLENLLPEYKQLLQDELHPLAKSAWKSYLFRAVILFIPILGLVWYFSRPFGVVVLILMVLSGLLGILRSRSGGYYIHKDTLIVQHRLFSKERIFVYKRRIQALYKKQNPLQKRANLATLRIANMSGITGRFIQIRQFTDKEIDQIAAWYRKK